QQSQPISSPRGSSQGTVYPRMALGMPTPMLPASTEVKHWGVGTHMPPLIFTLQGLEDHSIEQGKHDLVVSDESIACPPMLRGTLHHIVLRAIVLDHIQIHGEKTLYRIANIATEGEGLEKYFG